MKYKLIDGSTIYLAGVAAYTTGDAPKKESNKHKFKINLDFDFDNPKTFVFDFDKMKEEKEKYKKLFKEEAKKYKEVYKNEAKKYKEAYKSEASKQNESDNNSEENNETQSSDTSENKTQDNTFNFNEDFLNGFGDVMSDLGKNLEQWGESFGKSMESFGINLDKFGSEMDKFGSEIEKKVSHYAKDMEKHWSNDVPSDDYDTWELESLFNELYQNSDTIEAVDKTPHLYYKIDGYDLGTTMNDQLTFIGSHLETASTAPFGFVTKTLVSDKWLVLKLSKEEYAKDWMQQLDTIELLKDYNVEQYFITRHFKNKEDQESKKIKIYIPLKIK